jgi:SAM-dependent methyltransferase
MSDQYHLRELEIALDPQNPSHILPPPVPASHRVLDIGCGAGQTLMAAYKENPVFGIDIDFAALQLGKSLSSRICFSQGHAEALPFQPAQFDLVIARVSLPYTDLRRSLAEIRRVLRPGGGLWITLHSFELVRGFARRSNYKGKIFFGYIVLNSLLFHYTGRQFPFLSRYESFQTEHGMRRALERCRFADIRIEGGKHFLVQARAA